MTSNEISTFRACATSTPSSVGPFSLLRGREQVADRQVLTCYDSYTFGHGTHCTQSCPSTSREVYGRDCDFPTCGSPARNAEGRLWEIWNQHWLPSLSPHAERWIRTSWCLSLRHARDRHRSRCRFRCSHLSRPPDLSEPFLSGIKLFAHTKKLTGDLSEARVVEGERRSFSYLSIALCNATKLSPRTASSAPSELWRTAPPSLHTRQTPTGTRRGTSRTKRHCLFPWLGHRFLPGRDSSSQVQIFRLPGFLISRLPLGSVILWHSGCWP